MKHYKYLHNALLLFFLISILNLMMELPVLADPVFTIKPRFAGTWRTDNNFYKADENERTVYTYLYEPGIDVGFKTAKSYVSLDYTMNIFEYDDRDDPYPWQTGNQAEDDDYVGHTAFLDAKTKPFERLTIGLEDGFYYTRDPAQTDQFSNSIDRELYYVNRLTPIVYYDFNPIFAIGARYRNTKIDYDPRTHEDSVENRGIFDLIYSFNEKTSIDLEYQYWAKDFELTTSDYTSNQISLIIRNQFKYFFIEGGAGYHEREFDDPMLEDIDTFTYRIEITGQNPPAPEELVKSYISFISEWNFNDQYYGENYYEAHRLTLEAGHLFLKKITVNVEGYYQNSDYERTYGYTGNGEYKLREDHTYMIAGSLGYWFTDWLLFSVKAGYEKRNSNIDGYDYSNTFGLAKLDFRFNLGRKQLNNKYYKR